MTEMIETILDTQTIYEGRVITLDVQTVRLANGKIAERELLLHTGAAAVVPIDENGNVVLVRQYRTGAKQPLLEIPAGGLVDSAESPRACATRELQEEIGYKPEELIDLGIFFAAASYTTEQVYLYLSRRLQPSQLPPDADEFLEIERIPFDQALEMAYDGRLTDAKSIIAILRAARHINS